MPIEKFKISWLGPFREIELQFDKQVNIFVGPNNCGKSTVLMALAEALVFPFAVPQRLYRKGRIPKLTLSLWGEEKMTERTLPWATDSEFIKMVKQVGYTSFVPALRQNTGFRPTSPIGAENTERTRQRAENRDRITRHGEYEVIDEEEISTEDMRRLLSRIRPKLSMADREQLLRRQSWSRSPSRITDQAMIAKIVELDYRAYRKDEPRFREVISLIANIASEIMTGFHLTFDRIEEDNRGLYPQFKTPDGLLPLDKLSQGTQSIIQWMSQLILGMAEYYEFPKDLCKRKAVFIIDEIDSHMHPEWQLGIIPTITKNLPNCQIFASTHSPLILAGLTNGQVHLLNRGKKNEIVVSRNEKETFGWSVDQIMRWLMGMKDTVDKETEGFVDELALLRRRNKLDNSEKKQLDNLREEIHKRLVQQK